MQTRRTTRKQPGGTARRASVVVALAAAASLGALGAASAQGVGGVGGHVPAGVPSTTLAAPSTTGGTTGVSVSTTTAPDVSTAPASALDRDDVLALLTRADDYLAAHPDAVGGPVAQAASETGMLLVTYDAQVAATAALTPPVDLPVSALEPPDPLTTSPWDEAVGKTSASTEDDAAPTTDPTAPTPPAGTVRPSTAPSSTAPSSTASPGSTPSPTQPSDAATTGILAADGTAATGQLPTTGSTPTGAATDAPAGADASAPGDVPQANPTSPAGTVDDGAARSLIPDPATTAVQGSMPSADEPTSPPAPVPGGAPTAAPTESAATETPSPVPTSGVSAAGPTTAPTSPAGTVPTPSDDATTAPDTAPTTGPDGSASTATAPTTTAPTATAPTTAAPTDQGTPSTDPDPSASDRTTSTTTDTLADPDAQDGVTPVTWDDVVVAAERLATALDTAETADAELAGLTGPGAVDGVAAADTPLTGGLADQLKALADRYGTSIDGYKNGEIPASALCPLNFAPGQMLRCDAADRLEALNVLFEKQFGHSIPMTDSYRPIAIQIELRRTKPNLAAVPGTSNHGWGLAVDLGYPISTGRSAEYAWMREHGPAYGWDNPSWAHLDGSKPEPWHFEFYSGGVLPTGTPISGYDGAGAPADVEDGPKAPSDTTTPKTSEPGAATVLVPKGLVGKPFATVQKKLEGLGLKVAEPTKAYSATVKAGSVVRVTPGAGTKVKPGSTVRIVVSQGPKPATTVTIPDGLVGQPLKAVKAKLADLGLRVAEPTTAYSDTVKAGSVVSVSPDEGASVTAGSTVKLVVSQGPKPATTVTIPDGLAGQPLGTVQAKLEDLGLKVVVDPTKVYSDTVKAGSVVSTTPGAGTTVKGGSTIQVVVSQGPKPTPTTTVPTGLVGASEDAAVGALDAVGLIAAVTSEPNDDVAKGVVIRVDPAEGATVDAGATVVIVVSSGPTASDPDPTGTPTPAPTATSTPAGATSDPTVTPTEAAREADTD